MRLILPDWALPDSVQLVVAEEVGGKVDAVLPPLSTQGESTLPGMCEVLGTGYHVLTERLGHASWWMPFERPATCGASLNIVAKYWR